MRLYAFWSYSCFPFVLGGEVVGMNEVGLVKVKEYGGECFRPIKILPYEAGKELHAKLCELGDRHDRELRELRAGFLSAARRLLPEIT